MSTTIQLLEPGFFTSALKVMDPAINLATDSLPRCSKSRESNARAVLQQARSTPPRARSTLRPASYGGSRYLVHAYAYQVGTLILDMTLNKQ
jgi:hypothetical protein